MICSEGRKKRQTSVQKRPDAGQPTGEFVDREKFCNLLISRRPFRRFEIREQGICGLVDMESAQQYLIYREDLFDGVAGFADTPPSTEIESTSA